MIGFDKTITIYNKWFDRSSKNTLWLKTVIRGVSWAGCQRVTTGEGLTSKDGYSVRIPAASLPDGYLDMDVFRHLESPSGHCTAQNGDVVVLGEGPDVESKITEITQQFSHCFTVIAVHTDNLSRRLPHLRIEGR